MIKIVSPNIGTEEEKSVLEVLRSGNLAQGEKVEIFEKRFARFIGTKYAVATSSGTSALHLSLLALGIEKNNEVITTPFSFIASTNSILYVGAKPVFVDIDPKTFNIDPYLVEKKITPKTKAILPVHLYGLPADMKKINQVAKNHNLYVIEDACQAHGASINGKRVGSFGDVGCFSFYPTKNMTTGEGGMITTNNKKLAEKIRVLRNHGMKKKYYHEILGYNFRMTDMAAAIGIEQLKKLPILNKQRIKNALFLNRELSKLQNIRVPKIPNEFIHTFHQYTIRIVGPIGTRDKLALHLNENGIQTSVFYPIPIYKQEFIKKIYPDLKFENSEKVSNEVLSLPVHPLLTREELQKIVKSIKNFFSE